MQKTTIVADSDIRKALEGIDCPRPIKTALHNDARYGYLDIHVQTAIDAQKAEDVISAIRFLIAYEIENGKGTDSSKVNLSHLQGLPSNNVLYRKLKVVSGNNTEKNTGDQTRVFGIKSHVFIPQLFSGDFIKITKKDPVKISQPMLEFEATQELPLTVGELEKKRTRVVEKAIIRIRKIESAYRKLLSTMEMDLFPLHNPSYQKLLTLMMPIFNDGKKDGIAEILELAERNKETEYLAFLTILTWVTALARYKEVGGLILFKELSLMPYRYDVGLGRIDALAVTKINGEPPTRDQQAILKRLSYEKHESVGHLVQKLVQLFGENISLLVYDWKFAIGDGANGIQKTLNIIHRGDVLQKPILKHGRQMERYIATILISYAMVASNSDVDLESVWKSNIEISGEIHYFFPDSTPIVHVVGLSEEEKKEVFRAQVVTPYTDGEYRSKVTSVSKTWLNLSIGLIQNGFAVKKPDRAQLSFSGFDEVKKGRVSKLITDLIKPVFIDEFNIIEKRVGKDGKIFYKLHLDTLLEQAAKGNISLGKRYNYARGGFIPCFMHHDKTASFAINLKKGIFKCFGGCGIGGTIAAESIPDNLEGIVSIQTKRMLNRTFSEIQKFVAPARHIQVMELAQKYLQLQFLQSKGARYLEEVRGLNPELSWKNGAGFDDGGLIPYLLDMGVTYDELILYGFVNLQSWIKETHPFVKMLEERGYSIADIYRDVDDVDEFKKPIKVPALPFPILENRVTYPLDVQGIITNFYGRSVDPNCKKDYVHQKTMCNDGVPQGGFNITKAMNQAILRAHRHDTVPHIGLAESPIDVDTFIQRSDLKEWGGIVGTGNDLLQQLIALFPGDITIAFDSDPSKIDINGVERGRSGQRATVRLVEYLQSVDFEYRVFDFTEPIVKQFPPYKDINGFWVSMLRAYREYNVPIGPITVILHRKQLLPKVA